MHTAEQLQAEASRLLQSGQAIGISIKDLKAACEFAALGASRETHTTPPDSPEGKALAIAARQGTTKTEALRVISGCE